MPLVMNGESKLKTVLIGSSGTSNAFSSVLSLRRNWNGNVKIVAVDSNPRNLVTSSLLCDKFYQVPETCKPEFRDAITQIIKEENVDTYIPFIDEEIFVLALLCEENILNRNLCLQVKDHKIADLCNDKLKTYEWLSEMNILTPESFRLNQALVNDGHYVIKRRRGFGSRIIRLSDVKENLTQYSPDDFIIQYECEKPEITIDVCFNQKRSFFSYICRERIETKGGVCTRARLFYDESLEKTAYTIADKLSLNSFCFQVMNYKGDWAVTDINARPGAGTGMSVAAGMDFFSAMFAILWDEDPAQYIRPLKKETFVTRQYSDFIMNI